MGLEYVGSGISIKDRTLNLVVSAPKSPATPDTGFNTVLGTDAVAGSQAIFVALFVMGAVIATIMTASLIRCRNKTKFGFNAKKSTMVSKSLLVLMAIGLAGHAGGNLILQNSDVNAQKLDGSSANDDAAGLGISDKMSNESGSDESITLKAKAQLEEDESVLACVTDTVELPGDSENSNRIKYSLKLYATEFGIKDNKDAVIQSIEKDSKKLTDGMWGYKISGGSMYKVISDDRSEPSVIEDVNGDVEISYCAQLAPETEPGTYTTKITYTATASMASVSINTAAGGLAGSLMGSINYDDMDQPIVTFTTDDLDDMLNNLNESNDSDSGVLVLTFDDGNDSGIVMFDGTAYTCKNSSGAPVGCVGHTIGGVKIDVSAEGGLIISAASSTPDVSSADMLSALVNGIDMEYQPNPAAGL